MCEHQVLEVLGEDGRVLAGLGADGSYLALGIALVHTGAQRTAVLGLIVVGACLLVITVEVGDDVGSLANLALLCAQEVVLIQMGIAGALAEQDETVLYGGEVGIGIVGNIRLHLVCHDATALGRAWVGNPYLQVVLMTVLCEDEQFVGVAAELDAWDIAFSLQRHTNLSCGTALDVESVHGYLTVGLSGNGIFILVGTGIFGICLYLGHHTLVHGE